MLPLILTVLTGIIVPPLSSLFRTVNIRGKIPSCRVCRVGVVQVCGVLG